MTDLEAQIRACLATAAARAPSVDCLAAQVRDRRRRRRARIVAVGAAAVAAGLVLTVPVVSAVMPSGIPNPAATVTAGPSPRERQQDLVSCAGTVALVSSSADRVVVARSQPPPRMTLQVGDILTIDSTGDCESALSATPQTSGVLTVTSVDGYANRFRATSPGTVLVVVTHAACAELAQPNPGCLGGIVRDGSAEIEVVAP